MNEQDILLLYDFNQGMTVTQLSQKYNKTNMEVMNIIIESPPTPSIGIKNPESFILKVKLRGEIHKKMMEYVGDGMLVSNAIKLIVLDYLDFYFDESHSPLGQ